MERFQNPPKILTNHFLSEWHILRPTVYRYMPSQYVEEFFSYGKIRLSSFKNFAKHSDNQLRDSGEGQYIHQTKAKEGYIFCSIVGNENLYVLCGSTLNSKENFAKFNTNDCIAIHDTLGFCNAISKYINGFVGGAEGHTIYQDHSIIRRNNTSADVEQFIQDMKKNDPNYDMDKLHNALKQGGVFSIENAFFKLSKYANEFEYRMVWETEKTIEPFIDIVVPNAIKFCERIKL